MKNVQTLHGQTTHASKEKLIKLVKESKGFKDQEFLKSYDTLC